MQFLATDDNAEYYRGGEVGPRGQADVRCNREVRRKMRQRASDKGLCDKGEVATW